MCGRPGPCEEKPGATEGEASRRQRSWDQCIVQGQTRREGPPKEGVLEWGTERERASRLRGLLEGAWGLSSLVPPRRTRGDCSAPRGGSTAVTAGRGCVMRGWGVQPGYGQNGRQGRQWPRPWRGAGTGWARGACQPGSCDPRGKVTGVPRWWVRKGKSRASGQEGGRSAAELSGGGMAGVGCRSLGGPGPWR